jgi:hypothetical protein
MKQTLKQRIVPEVDERETERESSKIASYVEESLKDITPIDGGDPLFDTDEMFSDLEEMKDMTDEFFGDGFSVPGGSGGFAGDVLFEQGETDRGQQTETEQLESLRDLEAMFREMGGFGGGMLEPILALEEVMGKNMAKNGAIASAVGGMSKLLKAGGATLLLGGVGLAILGGLWSTVKGMAKHSPLLGTVVEMLGMVTTFLLRPFAHMIGQLLLPVMMDLLQVSAEFMSISFEQGIMNGMIYLGKTFLDAIFSIPGLLALAITAAGGALGAAIGGAAAAKIGGTIGAILGSVVPGIGTTVGAALGATIGVTLAGILGVLTAYNLDGIKNFISDIADAVDLVSFIAYAILGPFGLIAINFIDWIKKKWGKDIGKMAEYVKDLFNEFSDGGLSAVFNKVVEDADVRQILKDVIPRFDVWQQIKNAFPGWPTIPSFDLWKTIKQMFPGWPSIPTFDVWAFIKRKFPGWPNISWDGWGSFIDNVDLSDKVSMLDWDVPELPTKSEIAQLIKDMLDPRIDAEVDDIIGDGDGGNGSDGGGSGDGGEGIDPDDPRDAPSANPPGSKPDDDDDGGDDGDDGDGIDPDDPRDAPSAGLPSSPDDGSSEDPSYDPGEDSRGGIGNPGYGTGLASGGIVTDTLMTYVGEGRESEVVAPLSKLDSMIQSRTSPEVTNNISSVGEQSGSMERDLERVIQSVELDVSNDEAVRLLRKISRQLSSMDRDIDIEVAQNDSGRWEVNK